MNVRTWNRCVRIMNGAARNLYGVGNVYCELGLREDRTSKAEVVRQWTADVTRWGDIEGGDPDDYNDLCDLVHVKRFRPTRDDIELDVYVRTWRTAHGITEGELVGNMDVVIEGGEVKRVRVTCGRWHRPELDGNEVLCWPLPEEARNA